MFDHFPLPKDPLLTYQSASKSRAFLLARYSALNIDHADQAAYDNCYRFMYYLEHGELFFKQAQQTALAIQPVLAFYGLSHLIKACLLTVDPYYPSSVHVLAHGLSSRKRKKQNYHFFEDDVKVQRKGLFTHFSEKLFHVKHAEGTKLNMRALLVQLPELYHLFISHFGSSPLLPLKASKPSVYYLPHQILDDYKMTGNRLANYLKEKTNEQLRIVSTQPNYLLLQMPPKRAIAPCRCHLFEQQWYFSRCKTNEAFFPELMIYYALLYNLSMIARYETEWWYELIKMTPGEEFPFIKQFLSLCIQKSALLIAEVLKTEQA
ncbi:YaaC family protein [Bacillus xiapuensis]|uniref:YaaC family protein n=1 Tax=Bacillus xiapuensis TaxID=2014075 RepID=UPI0012FE08F2|nr:YaaC family protein [Bacillus xiapuensis]